MTQRNMASGFETDYKTGLNDEQVAQRVAVGLVNNVVTTKTKSYKEIFKTNLITFFNILNFVLAILVIITGYYKDLVFMLVVLGNLAIGISQEIISKKTLDKLNVLVATKASAVRNGKNVTLNVSDVVLDDIVLLKSGNNVFADSVLAEGFLEVNESLITGESDIITKKKGDTISSGSFVVSGNAYVRVINVGEDNIVNKIAGAVKVTRKRKSELRTALNKILKLVSSILIPLGILLFIKQYSLGLTWDQNILKTVAALIGMIPEGLILLTSVSLAMGAVILAYKQTLVQDLYCIETLARVDTLCLDKTGTLTEGRMHVKEIKKLEDFNDSEVMANICGALKDDNSTFIAIKEKFGEATNYTAVADIPFSSERKYSGVYFENEGSYILGATDFVFKNEELPLPQTDGKDRILVLAHSNNGFEGNSLPTELKPIAFIIIADKIRESAKDTINYFYEQDVNIKIISGDSASTVRQIATEAGVKQAELAVDANTLTTKEEVEEAILKYNVFGRVSPEQKQIMVSALKAQGHTVAMTGDGVNDVLALKASDCSIAMASGSDAAKNVSDIVLLESNFESMPNVVAEGRRVINNIERVATMFISKTVFSFLLAIFTLLLSQNSYPFSPLHLTMISFINIGFPAFFLALEPNNKRIEGSFITNVLSKSLPGGLAMFFNILLINFITIFVPASPEAVSTASIVLTIATGLWIVVKVSLPLTTARKIIILASIGIFVCCITFLRGFFGIAPLTTPVIIFCCILTAIMPFIMMAMEWVAKRIITFLNAVNKVKAKQKKK